MGKCRLLVALGGNAIKLSSETGTAAEQIQHCTETAVQLASVLQDLGSECELVLTHGNGPQLGNLAVQQDEAIKMGIPSQPMDILGAMTQGQIGYMLVQALENELARVGLKKDVISVITQVEVSPEDPELLFDDVASKPVGNFLTEKQAMQLSSEKGWKVRLLKPGTPLPWRRVVPSPIPISIVEAGAVRHLVDSGYVVISSGGGGVPVVRNGGKLHGVEAVIDKDLAGMVLAEEIGANKFMILTDVDCVKLNYGKPNQLDVHNTTVQELKEFLEEGHFGAGSMLPKVKACIKFVESGTGRESIIASLSQAKDSLLGKSGTRILP